MKGRDFPPEEIRVGLVFLRALRGWNQAQLAKAAGVERSQISLYEAGKRAPSGKTLERLLDAAGVPASTFRTLLTFIRLAKAGEEAALLPDPAAGSTVAQAVVQALETAKAQILVNRAAGKGNGPEEERREAGEAWERLKGFSPQDQQVLVDGAPEYQSWALCERLCIESERAAMADAGRAIDLAELALRVTGLVPGEEGWRTRLQGYAWASIGNARRLADDLPGAEAALSRARDLWQAGADGGPGLPAPRGIL